MATALHQTRFRVTGMDCASCAAKVGTAVRRLPGVDDVSVSVSAGTMTVTHGDELSSDAVAQQVNNLGYGIAAAGRGASLPQPGHSHEHDHRHAPGHDHDHDHDHGDGSDPSRNVNAGLHGHADEEIGAVPWWRARKAVLTIACGAALAVAYVAGLLVPNIERPAFLLALAVGLVPVARRAFVAARYGTPFSIEMLMTIAAVGAVIIGATEEAAAVVFLFLVGEMLEGVAAGLRSVPSYWCVRAIGSRRTG